MTPLQTLTLWNDPQFVEVAVVLGAQALAATDSDAQRVTYLMRALTSRPPTVLEEGVLLALLTQQRAAYQRDPTTVRALAEFDLERVTHLGADDDEPADEVARLSQEETIERAASLSTALEKDLTTQLRSIYSENTHTAAPPFGGGPSPSPPPPKSPRPRRRPSAPMWKLFTPTTMATYCVPSTL